MLLVVVVCDMLLVVVVCDISISYAIGCCCVGVSYCVGCGCSVSCDWHVVAMV